MTTGPDHYREAERLLDRAYHYTYGDGADVAVGHAFAAAAQAHATLALASAAIDAQSGRFRESPEDARLSAILRLADGRPGYHTITVKQLLSAGLADNEPDDEPMTDADLYAASELAEMDRDAEFGMDAADEARDAEEAGADR